MNRWSFMHHLRTGHFAVIFLTVAFAAPALPHETQEKVDDPGFRPETKQASAFVEAFDTATIAVYPAIIRRTERTAYSYESRGRIIASLNERSTGAAVIANSRIDMGRIVGRSQWGWFQDGIQAVSREVRRKAKDVDYSLVMEFVFPPDNRYVFGVHVFVLDREGESAFSFLLNSHHRSFVDANLVVEDSSEAAHTRVIEKATQLGLAALREQIEQARGDGKSAVSTSTSTRDAAGTDYPINELPMFGHMKKTAAQKRADREYIEFVTQDGRSRAAAADIAAKTGWNFYYQGDRSTAIKRFNQAWLLDPENQLALWGFAGICRDRDQLDEAIRYLEMAIDKGPENEMLTRDYQDLVLKIRQREQALAGR